MIEAPQILESKPSILIDSHVHVYPCFARDLFFDATLKNFQRGADELKTGSPHIYCVLLAETSDCHFFQELSDHASRGTSMSTKWVFEPCEEDGAVRAISPSNDQLIFVAGRQLATRGGLEILALCGRYEFPDLLPFDEALSLVLASDAIAVLPWGFGKWTFRRKRVVHEALENFSSPRLCLGDNGGRVTILGEPGLFGEARRREMKILPGSDPLPLDSHATRAGSYGLAFDGTEFDSDRPIQSLRALLIEGRGDFQTYGRLSSPAELVLNQIRLVRAKKKDRAL